jgi:hypothetical protein
MSGTHHFPVAEDAIDRTWVAERKCRADVQLEVLEIIIDAGWSSFRTFDLVNLLAHAHPEWKYGTCSAYVSGALLAFREAGWVRPLGRDGKTYRWEVDA